jgi:hypothetical protein
MTNARVEVITSIQRRRRWSAAEKEQLVAATLEPGASVSAVARAAGIHPSPALWLAAAVVLTAGCGTGLHGGADRRGAGIGVRVARCRPDRHRFCGRRADADHRCDRPGDGDGGGRGSGGQSAPMIPVPTGVRVWLATGQTEDFIDVYGSYAIKLLKLQTDLIFAFDRHRRGNRQTVEVRHVHLYPGSQGVIGIVNQGQERGEGEAQK